MLGNISSPEPILIIQYLHFSNHIISGVQELSHTGSLEPIVKFS